MLRILYIATSFPEPGKGATIYTDLAEALLASGHAITVAVAEQSRNMKSSRLAKERGIDVLRIVTGNYYGVGFLQKGITTLKIPLLMKRGIRKHLGDMAFDLLLFEAPPITNADLMAWAKKYFGCPAYLMLKDIFPQNAVDLGIIGEKGPVRWYFAAEEKKLYRTADFIGCMSPANRNYLLENNPRLNPEKVELFPNTKRLAEDYRAAGPEMRNRLGIPDGACVFLFGGNMGIPQYLDLLCEALKECREDQRIWFLFIGRGNERRRLEQTIEKFDIRNALVLDDLHRDDYERITREIDIGLIVLDPRFTIPNFPSRILSYMEYAKPVLAATDRTTDIRDLILEAGFGEWTWSGDTKGFIAKLREMSMRDDLAEMGQNGRNYIEEHFQVERSVAILESHFK